MKHQGSAYIALGSNLMNPSNQIKQALQSLSTHTHIRLIATSPFYASEALGPGEQANYINAVVHVTTDLPARELLSALHKIEDAQGRKRDIHWGPRTLDLDILLFNNDIINTDTLQVPHPRMLERNFVLYPLFDIAPRLVLPSGATIESVLTTMTSSSLECLGATLPEDIKQVNE